MSPFANISKSTGKMPKKRDIVNSDMSYINGSLHIKDLPIQDAPDSFSIEMREEDVAKSTCKTNDDCAFVQAIKRAIPKVEDVRVYRSVIYVKEKGKKHYWRYNTPARLRAEINVYDRTGRIAVGEYEIHPIPESRKQQNKLPRGNNGKGNKSGKRRKIQAKSLGLRPAANINSGVRLGKGRRYRAYA